MKKLLMRFATLAMVLSPIAGHAEQCRDTASGKFAKCGTPGAVPASQYVAKTKAAKPTHAKHAAAAAPVPMAKATAAPAAGKTARCKGAKGKFVKCGTPGAVPA